VSAPQRVVLTIVVMDSDEALELLVHADDTTLRNALGELTRILRERARDRGDLDELLEVGFSEGFDAKGMPRVPWIEAGILICPGGGLEKSSASHECSYVHVGEKWVWESEETLLDVVRRIPSGTRSHQRTVSLLDARDGLDIDVVVSRMRQGVHQMQRSLSYTVQNGQLVIVTSRAVTSSSQRW
jgi:hypothetical protein